MALSSLHASDSPAGGTAAAGDAVAESPMPAPIRGELGEPPMPLDEEQIAALFQDLRPVNGSADLIHVDKCTD